MRRIVLLILAAGALGAFSSPLSAAGAVGCGAVRVGSTAGISGDHLRTSGGLRCGEARSVLRSYFGKVIASAQVDGGCAQARTMGGCAVAGFRCFAGYGPDLGYVPGRCKGPDGEVRFHERDRGPG